MKRRDKILFALPIILFALLVIFSTFLYWQINNFEKSYRDEAVTKIINGSDLIATIIKPNLDSNQLEKAIDYCNNFDNGVLRLSLIDATGKVIAESEANSEKLDNHLQRTEIKKAFAGENTTNLRYSDTLSQWMLYHAMKIESNSGVYILRTAVSSQQINNMIEVTKRNIAVAIILGIIMIVLFTYYLIQKIRAPIINLQNSASMIAQGNLGAEIVIPEKGFVRDLALTIKAMTKELKKQLQLVTIERNEKEKILDSMDDAVVVVDENCNVVKLNHAAKMLFNINNKDSKFNIARANITNLVSEMNNTFASNVTFEKEFELNYNDIKLTLLIKSRILEEKKNKYLLLNITNLTNLRKLESFRSDFIANVSHEIKTPLTSIIGSVEMLNESENLDENTSRKLLKIITKESKRLNVLVQDILSLAALEKRQLDPHKYFDFTSLDTVMQNAVNMCHSRAEDAEVVLQITSEERINCYMDGQLVEQALINLIQNALKYSNSKLIEVSVSRDDDFAIATVKDFGIGIAKEHQQRIFERFYRVHKERSRNLGGTGLGLAIVKHIVQLHDGKIELHSDLGKGTSFVIKFPL